MMRQIFSKGPNMPFMAKDKLSKIICIQIGVAVTLFICIQLFDLQAAVTFVLGNIINIFASCYLFILQTISKTQPSAKQALQQVYRSEAIKIVSLLIIGGLVLKFMHTYLMFVVGLLTSQVLYWLLLLYPANKNSYQQVQ